MNPDMKFLVVDDFSTMRRIIKSVLNDLGFSNITEADDGSTALPLLRDGEFDFLITDWNMPGMPGLDLLKAVRLSALIASTAANVVKLKVGEDGSGAITIAANSDSGDASGEVEAQLEGDGVTIAFNARYLTEALQNLSSDQLALEFSGPLSPGVLKPTDDPDYVHVIMPVRTPS